MARNTPERILAMALVLFNEDGEPHVTTNRIADELDISPGNLHYHFRTKGDLIEALFEAYEVRMLSLLATPDERDPEIEDIWLFLHLVFETIGEFRFFYRDLIDLCSRFRSLSQRFRGILRLSVETARGLLEGLIRSGQMQASDEEIDSIARNIVLISTFWLAFDQVLERDAQPRPDRAVAQVMNLVSPFLLDQARAQMQALVSAYKGP